MNTSLIPEAFAKLLIGNKASNAFARVVDSQNHDNLGVKICLAWQQLQDERSEAAKVERDTGVRGRDPIVAPEVALSFIQQLMNQVCWSARRLYNANLKEEFGNGIDFSQDVGEQVGLYTENDHIADYVDADFMVLNEVHTDLAAEMPYLTDVDSLWHFAQSEQVKVGEAVTYKQLYACTSFGDAQVAMDTIVEELEAKQKENDRSRWLTKSYAIAS